MNRPIAVALAALALLTTACDVPTNEDPVELSGQYAQLETTTTTATTAPPGTTKEVVVYLLRTGDGEPVLEPVTRSVDLEVGIAGILNNLFTQPPSEPRLESAIPPSSVLLSANRSSNYPNRLIVDVQGLFGDGGPEGTRLRNALAQIVWTATAPGRGVDEVIFRSEGEPADALVDDLESTSQPVGRCDYRFPGDGLGQECA